MRFLRWLRSRRTARSEFDAVVRDTIPPMTEAEMDRYRRYHGSNQYGM